MWGLVALYLLLVLIGVPMVFCGVVLLWNTWKFMLQCIVLLLPPALTTRQLRRWAKW